MKARALEYLIGFGWWLVVLALLVRDAEEVPRGPPYQSSRRLIAGNVHTSKMAEPSRKLAATERQTWSSECAKALAHIEAQWQQAGAVVLTAPRQRQQNHADLALSTRERLCKKTRPVELGSWSGAERRGIISLGPLWRSHVAQSHEFAATERYVFSVKCDRFASSLGRGRSRQDLGP